MRSPDERLIEDYHYYLFKERMDITMHLIISAKKESDRFKTEHKLPLKSPVDQLNIYIDQKYGDLLQGENNTDNRQTIKGYVRAENMNLELTSDSKESSFDGKIMNIYIPYNYIPSTPPDPDDYI